MTEPVEYQVAFYGYLILGILLHLTFGWVVFPWICVAWAGVNAIGYTVAFVRRADE